MKYTILYNKNVLRDIKKIDPKTAYRIWLAIDKLAENPRPSQCIKLQGTKNEYRIRIGNFRVLFVVFDEEKTIQITYIKHRKDAYR